MRRITLRHNYEAGGVFVQTMDDSRPLDPADSRQPLAMGEKRIHERAGRRTGRGMDDHALRLVDHDQVFVFVHDVKRQFLRQDASWFRRRDGVPDGLACLDLVRGS